MMRGMGIRFGVGQAATASAHLEPSGGALQRLFGHEESLDLGRSRRRLGLDSDLAQQAVDGDEAPLPAVIEPYPDQRDGVEDGTSVLGSRYKPVLHHHMAVGPGEDAGLQS